MVEAGAHLSIEGGVSSRREAAGTASSATHDAAPGNIAQNLSGCKHCERSAN